MYDNTTPPGFAKPVATDEIGGVDYQRVKIGVGDDGVAVDVSSNNPMPIQAQRSDDLLEMLQRMVKVMESLAIVDVAQRQRISLDAIAAGVALPVVTLVSGVTTVATVTTVGTVTTVSNIAANAGMDREQYINVAKQTYGTSIRPQLSFA